MQCVHPEVAKGIMRAWALMPKDTRSACSVLRCEVGGELRRRSYRVAALCYMRAVQRRQ
jgi:hypothetical protein